MPLKIIGSGFGRTGTKSTKDALEILEFGPCHHMYEVIGDPSQVAIWQAIAAGESPDWEQVFAGYVSQVDWPGAQVWQQTMAVSPDAKVLYTETPEEKWAASFANTIGKLMVNFRDMPLPPHIHNMMDACDTMIMAPHFKGRPDDPDIVLAAYQKHNADVRALVPPERLLVFDVAEGWVPLCAFLDVPVPDQPFPHMNLRADFWEALGDEPA